MPPKRRSGNTRSQVSAQQRQLSFHGKQNRITKPHSDEQDKSAKKTAELENAAAEIEIEEKIKAPTTAEKAIEQQVKDEVSTLEDAADPLVKPEQGRVSDVLGGEAKQDETGATGGKGSGWVGDEEAQARKISQRQIKGYWKERENSRITPRVHQEDLSMEEKILREWDMTSRFGVSLT